MEQDIIVGEILEDGTVKITTGNLTGSNHKSADAFVEEVAADLGGEVEKTRKNPLAHKHNVKPKFA